MDVGQGQMKFPPLFISGCSSLMAYMRYHRGKRRILPSGCCPAKLGRESMGVGWGGGGVDTFSLLH